MITVKNNCFHLATENTSYVFFINERGIAEHLYYGRRLRAPEMDTDALRMKRIVPRKGEVSLSQRSWEVTLNDTPLEFSCESNGDFRTPFISMRSGRSCVSALDLRFRRSETFEGVRRADSPLVQATASGQEAHGVLQFIDVFALQSFGGEGGHGEGQCPQGDIQPEEVYFFVDVFQYICRVQLENGVGDAFAGVLPLAQSGEQASDK